MKTPAYLQDQGTIGFVAPSFGCNTSPYKECFDSALEQFHNKGFGTILGPNCYIGEGVGISNKPELCAKEFMEMYENPEANVLISCGGGELMCEILEYIDFDRLMSLPPKWFAGYSDNTNLTYLLTTICDVKSLYSVCAQSYGMKEWYQNHYDTLEVLQGKKKNVSGYPLFEKESLKGPENPYVSYHLTEDKRLRIFDSQTTETSEISMSGRLLGGCMDCLVNLLGTKYDKTTDYLERYKEDGFIWFLEACELNVFSIRRAMWQMEQAGWFRYVKGFVIGRPMLHGQILMGLDQYEAVLPVVRKLQVPVIFDADFGHIAPAMPIVCGSYAEIKAKNNDLVFCMD